MVFSWTRSRPGKTRGAVPLVWCGAELYAAGGSWDYFRILKWDGRLWVPLSSRTSFGVNQPVRALLADGDHLYAGGAFRSANDQTVNRVAAWDGDHWTPLGDGLGGAGRCKEGRGIVSTPDTVAVHSLALMDGDLYAGGSFTTADFEEANRIARWDGERWSTLDSGIKCGTVRALAATNGRLYAGGYFTEAGGKDVNNIATWNGHEWAPLGDWIGGGVEALAVIGDTVYAGGPGGISKWDGEVWSDLGLGVDGRVVSSHSEWKRPLRRWEIL